MQGVDQLRRGFCHDMFGFDDAMVMVVIKLSSPYYHYNFVILSAICRHLTILPGSFARYGTIKV